ncbi:MAG: alpha/beta hydrolase, partial [Pseudomonadota bacterium]
MIPFRFGPVKRQLFGAYHPGEGGRQPSQGVLLCNPFGQEAVRLHRFYRVLADRLSRTGFHVLRFDYFGTGESSGDDEQGDLDGWCQDLLTAHETLLQRAMCAQVTWVGARLGGSLAALASAQAARIPDRLVLWETIVDGNAYLQELATGHVHATTDEYRPAKRPTPKAPQGEAIGFAMSDTLIQQLGRLTASVFNGVKAGQVRTIASADDPHSAALKTALTQSGVNNRSTILEHAFDWTSAEA